MTPMEVIVAMGAFVVLILCAAWFIKEWRD